MLLYNHHLIKRIVLLTAIISLSINSMAQKTSKWKKIKQGEIIFITISGGPRLGYSESSGVKLMTINGVVFKDLNKNGKLDKYEDWRLPFEERAKDLASKMSIQEIAGLMLYSGHQAIPANTKGFSSGT